MPVIEDLNGFSWAAWAQIDPDGTVRCYENVRHE